MISPFFNASNPATSASSKQRFTIGKAFSGVFAGAGIVALLATGTARTSAASGTAHASATVAGKAPSTLTSYNIWLYDSNGNPYLSVGYSIVGGHIDNDNVSPSQTIGTVQPNDTILSTDGVTILGYVSPVGPCIK